MAVTSQQVAELYVATFNRAPDADGLDYWVNLSGLTIEQIAQSFFDQAETQTLYPTGTTDEAFVTSIYTNLFNRAPDADGLAYWVAELANGTMSRDVMIEAMKNGALAGTNLVDKQIILNKAEVALYFAETLGLNTTDFSLTSVTAFSSTVTAAKTSADNIDSGATTQAQFTLTTNTDLIAGTAADEAINAFVGTITATGALSDTLQSVDIIDGGAGTDTLNISVSTGTAAPAMKIDNVENVVFTDYTGNGLNMTNVTGVTSVTNSSSTANTSFTGVDEKWGLTVKNVSGYNTAVTTTGTTLGGTSDSITVTVENAINNADVTLTDATYDYETVNVVSNGTSNKIDMGGTAVTATTSLVITGAADLNIDDTDGTNAMAALTTVNASAFTGKLTASVISAAVNVTVTGGTGDDTVTLGNFTKDDVVNLGDGADKLIITTAAALSVTTAASLTNIETIAFSLNSDSTDAKETTAINLSGATSLTTVNSGATTAGTKTNEQTLTLTNLAATATTLNLNGDGATVDTDLNTVSFGLKTSSGTADALTVNVSNTDAIGNVIVPTTKGVQLAGALTANGIETLTINSAALGADSLNTTALTADGGVALTITDDTLKTLTITGSTLVDLDGSALDDNVKTVDASATTGGVTVDLSLAVDTSTSAAGGTSAVSVTMGSGNDYVKTLNGTVNSTVSLGAGNDVISVAGNLGSGGGAAETITIDAGAGNDTVDLSADATASTVAAKAITLGDGVDTLKINGAATQTGITVADFVANAGGDKIDLGTNAATVAGAAVTGYQEIATGTAAVTSGLIVYTGNDIAAATEAGIQTLFDGTHATNNLELGAGNTTADVFYFAASNGTDTYLFHVTLGGANVEFTAAEDTAVLVATLTGISDASTISVDNFTDFLA